MKNKLHTILLTSIICFTVSFAQETTYYLPGTGTTVKALDFESASALTEKFNYGNGWAGTGFGLTGTQRGAPEIISVIENPEKVPSSGNQVLAFRSQERDAAWYVENPSAVGTNVYGVPDATPQQDGGQDDFFMTGPGWTSSDTPSVMMHVFLPDPSDDGRVVTSLRMTVKFDRNGNMTDSWPGIWCYGSYLHLRGPGRNDIRLDIDEANGGKDSWWTLGLSIAPDGDIQYYATPSYVTELTAEHFIGSNSVISPEAGLSYFPVSQSNDAIIMNSNINMTTSPTLIDNLFYTKGTTQVLSVQNNEMVSMAMYPNPTSDYLFVKGLNDKSAYKIVDGLGRIVGTGSISSASDKINVNALSKGVYILSLDGFRTQTFIKN